MSGLKNETLGGALFMETVKLYEFFINCHNWLWAHTVSNRFLSSSTPVSIQKDCIACG